MQIITHYMDRIIRCDQDIKYVVPNIPLHYLYYRPNESVFGVEPQLKMFFICLSFVKLHTPYSTASATASTQGFISEAVMWNGTNTFIAASRI